jgi:hypothetical protein
MGGGGVGRRLGGESGIEGCGFECCWRHIIGYIEEYGVTCRMSTRRDHTSDDEGQRMERFFGPASLLLQLSTAVVMARSSTRRGLQCLATCTRDEYAGWEEGRALSV